MSTSFLTDYLHYTSDSEVPASFHRWSAIAGMGAMLERNIYLTHGHSTIHANQYLMLIGTAGTRKSTAIKLMKSLISQAGFTNFASERTSKEKFLCDLAGEDGDAQVAEDILEKNLWGPGADTSSSDVRSVCIAADEANDFFGIGNLEFLSILGSLWDWNSGSYSNRIKTGKSVSITNPTISIIAGNTPTGFSVAFPPDILGQGFFSRLLLVYGEPNGKRIAFPKIPDPQETTHIVKRLQQIKSYHYGAITYTPSAEQLLTKIYNVSVAPPDMRFDSYFNRRFTHLLKLCLIIAASRLSTHITEPIVVEANTYLTYIENLMSKALGEFGKSKNSDITHRILSHIESRDGCTLKELLKLVSSDLEKPSDIGDIIRKLSVADKIQTSHGLFLPVRKRRLEDTSGLTDLSFLTKEELNVKG